MAREPQRRRDPLSADPAAKAIAAATLATVLLAACVSATSAVPADLPGIALGSTGLLHVERALLAGAAAFTVLAFLVRGWSGLYPSKVSTAGAEYPSLIALEQSAETSDGIERALADLRSQHDELAELTTRDIAALRAALAATTEPD